MTTRLTIVTTDTRKADLDWRAATSGRLTFLESLAATRVALDAAIHAEIDIDRIIVDRAGGAEEYLDLLARLPGDFLGDVVLIRDDGAGYLSASARGGDRVLYALTATDIRFYLEAHDLVTGRGFHSERLSA